MSSTREDEQKLLMKILKNERLIRLVKATLTNLILRILDNLKFDPLSFFSDNKYKFGNIGIPNEDNIQKKLEYLKSSDSTIREKVTAISNSVIDGSDENVRKKYNTEILCKYIRDNKDNKMNSWLELRSKQMDSIIELGQMGKTDTSHLWAPIYLLYDAYRTKYYNIKGLLNTFDKFNPDLYGINSTDLNEPLSDHELEFMQKNNINSKKKLLWTPGNFIYKDVIKFFPEFKNRDKSLIVGGVSGHTILMIELSLLLEINWIPILFACIIIQVPHHHSITEIVDALIDMNLIKKSTSVEETICQIAKQLDIEL